jgi:hypothetical protein
MRANAAMRVGHRAGLLAVAGLSASVVGQAAATPVSIVDPGFAVFVAGTTTPANDNRLAGTVAGPQFGQPLSNAQTGASTGELADVPAGWNSAGGGNGRFRDDIEFSSPSGFMAGALSPNDTIIFQDLGVPVLPNSTYTATIKLIDRNSAPLTGGTDVTGISANPHLALTADVGGAGQTDLGGTLTFVPPPNGGSSLMTLIVNTGAIVPSGDLFIVASTSGANADGIANTQTFFDDATLDRVAVPEPGALSLAAAAGLLLTSRRRRAAAV